MQPPRQPQSRPSLSDDELHRAKRRAASDGGGFDVGAIGRFLNRSDTRAYVVSLNGGGRLVMFTTAADERVIAPVATQTDALLTWLGTPRGFTVYLYWRHDPRRLAATEWPSRRNVNGGWTVPGSRDITVYRSEEWDRVLIHETIHALEWDWDMPETPMPCWKFRLHDTLQPALFEAWTELYAEWLWCGWHNMPWSTQRAWQDAQAVQILARAAKKWSEDTNVFAYYVLKAALAPHMPFLWVHGKVTAADWTYVLCDLIEADLARLRRAAATATLKDISLRMTCPSPVKK